MKGNRPSSGYKSVINTAKNGKLIRAEFRELVLCYAFLFGLSWDKKIARELYPNNKLRYKQLTILRLPDNLNYNRNLPRDLGNAIKRFLPILEERFRNYNGLLYDTKKLRIYRNRMQYGEKREIILDKIINYFWTPLLLVFIISYAYKDLQIDLLRLNAVKKSYNPNETLSYLYIYFKVICNLDLESSENTYTAYSEDYKIIFPNNSVADKWLEKAVEFSNIFNEKVKMQWQQKRNRRAMKKQRLIKKY